MSASIYTLKTFGFNFYLGWARILPDKLLGKEQPKLVPKLPFFGKSFAKMGAFDQMW